MARLPSEGTDRPDLERSQSVEAESPAVVAETEAPERTNSWIWIAAGVLLIVAGGIRFFTGDLEVLDLTGALLAIILISLGFLCFFIAGGFIRRPRGRGRESAPPPA